MNILKRIAAAFRPHYLLHIITKSGVHANLYAEKSIGQCVNDIRGTGAVVVGAWRISASEYRAFKAGAPASQATPTKLP